MAMPATLVCSAPSNQDAPKLVKVNDGFIVLWQDGRRGVCGYNCYYRDIYAQKFDVDGNMKWVDNGRVIAAGNNGEASNHLLNTNDTPAGIVSDTQGGAISLWTEYFSCSSGPCSNGWVTRVNSNSDVQWGAPPSPGVTIQGTDTAVFLGQHANADAIAPDGEGGAFVIQAYDAWGSWNVFRLDANGAFRSITPAMIGARAASSIIYGGSSNGKDYVYIAWWDYGIFRIVKIEDPEANYPITADSLQTSWTITLTSSASWWIAGSLTSDGAGGAIVAWEDDRNSVTTGTDIFVQRINSDSTLAWTPGGVPIAVQPNRQYKPQVVSDGAGGAVIVWEDQRTSPTQAYAQHVDSKGTIQWTQDGIPLRQGEGRSPKIIRASDGNYIVVYLNGNPDCLRTQRISPSGSLLEGPDGTTIMSRGLLADFEVVSDGDGGAIVVWSWAGNIYAARTYFTKIFNLVTKYYQDILDRDPEPGGAESWKAETERIYSLEIDLKEGFQALARFFFNSQEYQLQGKNNTEFVTNLYQTFLNRPPDPGGLSFWIDYLNQGLTRNMLITQFAYSEEYELYMANLFGNWTVRPEDNLVNDLYRGFLNRFPDTAGFNMWLGMMRSAQCQGEQAVRDLTYQIASAFVRSNEYALRNRSNQEYVEDLYNAILRRGADPAGFTGWVGLLNAGIYTREQFLPFFTNSAEFQFRVDEVISAGCLQ